jgi:hypothetical protein
MALTAAEIRERYLRIREHAGERVTVVAATKYVSVEELGILVEAGVEVVGENRAQDLLAKHAVYGDAFRWHFIGHLQSNKAKVVNELCELVHSLDSDSAARKLTVPALLEVNLSGEETKSGVAPGDVGGWVERHPTIRGLMTMPPLADDPEASRPWFARLAALAADATWEALQYPDWRDDQLAGLQSMWMSMEFMSNSAPALAMAGAGQHGAIVSD